MQAKRDYSLDALTRDLNALLARPGYTQETIAQRTRLDQPVVSRAKHGTLRRVTPRIERLCDYVDRELRGVAIPDGVARSVQAFLVAGGDPDLLVRSIDLLAMAVQPTRGTLPK
ncbi:helix-turn-helix domain-containing protein [Phenylobacterium sp. J426]|uniref:helix-turn-helix domain-containing protein n=1 Tax=Phenylobacterium sp. J426 TaxID=2898439 RepID=UPI002150E469|nr:helix-turn-helix domain-containing protein [Phenylobacterium sp. J426]MCR5876590.1 helix-turn-helix domain-containing protein [Phenylobacterium sp. J426]